MNDPAQRITISVPADDMEILREAQRDGLDVNVSAICATAIRDHVTEWRADRMLMREALAELQRAGWYGGTLDRFRQALSLPTADDATE
ncbi:hypothetical protein CMI37_21395 [Candidatus Pacearchaeota archaeon]|nr:hypothetical protein [Candidatus Pacearchaeota archaeon]|tara:strand:- start:1177 stop:1443 length:267 start_codon:yes stop_codon:yes gene_type:complete